MGMFLVAFFFLSGCGKKDENASGEGGSADAEWSFEETIGEEIKGKSTNKEDVKLGNLEENKVSFVVQKGSFDEDSEVVISNPEEVPKYDSTIMDPLGSPIDISAGKNKRMNEKATVTFRFNENDLPQGEEIYQIRVAYFDGKQWDYVKPAEVDKEKGLITFETYHFSLLGPVKVKDETKITEDWIHSQAVDSVLRNQINDEVDNVANQITDMIMAKMGITDESSRGKVMSELLSSDRYKEIYDEYQKGNTSEASQKIAVLAGEKIAQNVPESVFSKALGNVVGSADDVAKVSQAAGYAAEGQYKEASRIIGEQIADKFLITTAGKIAVEMVDYQIQSWKNSEVEAAYEAYRNGADGVFWGYNVDPGDFDAVWLQMRGIRRQLELERIKKENSHRKDAGMPELTERQEELMRASVKEKYRKQFQERAKKDKEIKEAEDQLRILVKAFKEKDVFSDSLGPAGLDKGYDFEQKLELVNHFAQKMMKDTNRYEVLDKETTLKEGALTAKSIALGARIYFSEPDGKKKYQDYLQSNFGISPYPELKNLKGQWNGTITITNVHVSEELKQKSQDNSNAEEGECDFSMNLDDLIGEESPFALNISPGGENSGTITLGSEDEKMTSNFTYQDGVISAPISQDEATGNITLNFSESENGYSAEGPVKLSYKEGKASLTASVKVKKGK